MLYLKDLLPANKKVRVEYRCNGPVDEYGETEDMLFGYALWNGEELISGDGDNYYLNDIVEHYKWYGEEDLTIWIEVIWNVNRKEAFEDD